MSDITANIEKEHRGAFEDYYHILTTKNNSAISHVVTIPGFLTAPGSTDKHHAYTGGLLVHTGEVLCLAQSIANGHMENVDLRVLLTAAAWHDVMKIRDYAWNGEKWVKTPYIKHIRHVAGSYAAWLAYANAEYKSEEFIDAVGHCILAHHGRKEWGSPVEPQTVEAFILHQADMLSACYGRNK